MRNREGTESAERQSQSRDKAFNRRHGGFKHGRDASTQSDAYDPDERDNTASSRLEDGNRHRIFRLEATSTKAQQDNVISSDLSDQGAEKKQFSTIEGRIDRLSKEEITAIKSAIAAEHSIHREQFPSEKTAAAVEGGPCALSGWEHGVEGFVQATEEVRKRSKQIGHELRPHKLFDKGVPGRFNASHAEKQISVVATDKPIAVSKPMCSDCQSYFRASAGYMEKSLIVADPRYVRIFYSDGRVAELPK